MIPLNRRARKVAPLLFGSGLCALVYQVVWTREFRLVFGASTAASAAVLAIFIGGLGAGGLLLGKRADQHPRPLAFYGQLETVIALSAALSPGLLWLVRWLYIQLGGTVVLGLAGGTAVRLLLAALVLGVPTFLMGGTLPAAARAVASDDDAGRRNVALLYGVNTLGAVTGSLLSTFWMLELFGNRSTLWCAALVNLLVAMVARRLSRSPDLAEPATLVGTTPAPAEAISPEPTGAAAPIPFVLGAAALVGFAFFLMELVWYRMLGPLLGGTVFTFGLILAVALLGIGLGGMFYSLYGKNKPATLRGFAYTCLIEAACMVIPFALGDRIAVLALLLRPLGNLGFIGHVFAWSAVTGLVVLPAAFAAGVQFPLMIALLGRARRNVGKEIGLVYAWNTVGAICGSLAGGFGLMPALTAPGCWRLVVVILAVSGVSALALSAAKEGRWARLLPAAATAGAVFIMALAAGPSAAWRHSSIGAGRVEMQTVSTPNEIRDWVHGQRAAIRWEAEGVESSVAINAANGIAFVLNGKVDGNSRRDAPTAVMSGLVGALIHGNPHHAMVVGLGTGSTAGWLAAIPSTSQVDVVELESAILEVARACAPVTANALENPKVHVSIADAREVLLATPKTYDLVFSEPSNPYRAGIASLFTQDYYRAVALRLNEGGIFLQWVQAYEVDGRTVRSVFATLASVFPEVELWQLGPGDLLLVASKKPLVLDAAELRNRIQSEPFRTALGVTWRVNDLEGFLAHHLAGPGLARAIAEQEGDYINTDDRNYVEFGFARGVGKADHVETSELQRAARAVKSDRPAMADGAQVDWSRVDEKRVDIYVAISREPPALPMPLTAEQRSRIGAQTEFVRGNRAGALAAWRSQPREPESLNELVLVAEGLADAGDEKAKSYLDKLPASHQAEAEAILARLQLKQGKTAEAAQSLASSFTRFQTDPWPWARVMSSALSLVETLAAADKAKGRELFEILQKPFAVNAMEVERMAVLVKLTRQIGFKDSCVPALKPFEPIVPWNVDFLRLRQRCYQANAHPYLARASAELGEFLDHAALPFGHGLSGSGDGLRAGASEERPISDVGRPVSTR
jgi:spermidine synthase